MKKKEAVKLLKAAGFTMQQGKGDHEKWQRGEAMVVITGTRELSPGVTRQVLKAIEKS
ncbi:MAG: type II toxin-antitoxin system HicA family toxin [Actinomycetaceae bacterium]|nr:type II toxin-antitoxin system HicA family toxin [Actinomycetaceae bacterium]